MALDPAVEHHQLEVSGQEQGGVAAQPTVEVRPTPTRPVAGPDLNRQVVSCLRSGPEQAEKLLLAIELVLNDLVGSGGDVLEGCAVARQAVRRAEGANPAQRVNIVRHQGDR